MNDERFNELVGKLLDGELLPEEVAELSPVLQQNQARRRELRQQLVLWELWSQQQAPERSPESFIAALHTRWRAEHGADAFVAQTKERLDAAEHGRGIGRFSSLALAVWRGLGRDRVAWAAGTSVAALLLGMFLWFTPHEARATVTLHGEAVCTACTLHETHAHLPAIRVHDHDKTVIYYVDAGRLAIQKLGDYCAAPVPLVARGSSEMYGGRRIIYVNQANREPRQPQPGPGDNRVLFPF